MRLAFAVSVLLMVPAMAETQSATLAVGARVRVTSPSDDLKRHVATVTEVRGDTIVVVTAPNFGLEKHVTAVTEMRGDSIVVGVKGGSRTVAFADISALEVSAGKRMRVVPYALLGLGVGAVGGFAVGYASYEEGAWCCANSASGEGAFAGAAFGVIGLFTGAIVGVFHRGDNWVPAATRTRAAIGTTPTGGLTLGISRAF